MSSGTGMSIHSVPSTILAQDTFTRAGHKVASPTGGSNGVGKTVAPVCAVGAVVATEGTRVSGRTTGVVGARVGTAVVGDTVAIGALVGSSVIGVGGGTGADGTGVAISVGEGDGTCVAAGKVATGGVDVGTTMLPVPSSIIRVQKDSSLSFIDSFL